MSWSSTYYDSFYRSRATLPTTTLRSVRSSSVDTYRASSVDRFARASTVGPSSDLYYGHMPFSRSLASADSRFLRASTVEPVSVYRREYVATAPYARDFSSRNYVRTTYPFDYKVRDYSDHLDWLDRKRDYLNRVRSAYSFGGYVSPYYSYLGNPSLSYSPVSDQLGASRDLYTYKHFRKSSRTLLDRNTRATSPMLSRELDRYYNTSVRSSYLGDVSSGGQRDFRYYNYRAVPYFGGSDYYSYVHKATAKWNNDLYPFNRPNPRPSNDFLDL